MESTANLVTFASLANTLDDAVFFRTHENPTALGVVDPTKRPPSWEHYAVDGPFPDTDEALGLSKGSYVILVSASAQVAYFYRVKAVEAQQGQASAFKQSLTMMALQQQAIDAIQRRLDESEAVSTKLAEKLDKKSRKAKKLKKKLKETSSEQWADVAEIVISTIFDRLGLAVVKDDEQPQKQNPPTIEIDE